MRVLYLYLEEWTGRRAREVHTLNTCLALVRNGWDVTLLTAGGEQELRQHLEELAAGEANTLRFAALSRSFGPLRSAGIFARRFRAWLREQPKYDAAFAIHLKAAALLAEVGLAYTFESHEIFAETPRTKFKNPASLEQLERVALTGARMRVVTSLALEEALRMRYGLPDDIVIAPNAGMPPLGESVANADGPFVYLGSIADWKGLDTVIEAARLAVVPLKVVGGSEAEWRDLSHRCKTDGVAWLPRVPAGDIPQALAGARAGLISTRLESGSGRYSCPMKLFDYARCGLPVLSTALPALHGLQTDSWCTTVFRPTVDAWSEALRAFAFDAATAERARRWSAMHTWDARARCVITAWGNL